MKKLLLIFLIVPNSAFGMVRMVVRGRPLMESLIKQPIRMVKNKSREMQRLETAIKIIQSQNGVLRDEFDQMQKLRQLKYDYEILKKDQERLKNNIKEARKSE